MTGTHYNEALEEVFLIIHSIVNRETETPFKNMYLLYPINDREMPLAAKRLAELMLNLRKVGSIIMS